MTPDIERALDVVKHAQELYQVSTFVAEKTYMSRSAGAAWARAVKDLKDETALTRAQVLMPEHKWPLQGEPKTLAEILTLLKPYSMGCLADVLGVTKAQLSRWTNEKVAPSYTTCLLLQQVLGEVKWHAISGPETSPAFQFICLRGLTEDFAAYMEENHPGRRIDR